MLQGDYGKGEIGLGRGMPFLNKHPNGKGVLRVSLERGEIGNHVNVWGKHS